MDKPLSYSAYGRYHLCPHYYYRNDILGDRPLQMSSALAIGSIVDEVITGHYEGKQVNFRELCAPYLEKRMKFFIHDLDLDFVDLKTVEDYAKDLGWKGKDMGKALKDFIKAQDTLSENQYKVLSLACWQSIDVKIECMLEGFFTWIAPKIKRILSVQEYVNDGKTHGYLDFIAETTDGKTVLFDLKTSKSAYDFDAVKTSPQLALYCSHKGIQYAGYIVLVKTLKKNKVKTCECGYSTEGGNRKKCKDCGKDLKVKMKPTSYAQYMVDKVPKYNKELTTKALNDTIACIDKGLFPRNLNTCNWVFGEPCQYKSKCWGVK